MESSQSLLFKGQIRVLKEVNAIFTKNIPFFPQLDRRGAEVKPQGGHSLGADIQVV